VHDLIEETMSDNLEVNLFIGRLHEAFRASRYFQSVSRHHFRWDRRINITLVVISALSAASWVAYKWLPAVAVFQHVPLFSGISLVVSEALRQLIRKVYKHSQRAEAMRQVANRLGVAFDQNESVFVQILRGQLTEQDIVKAADNLSVAINKAYGLLPKGMILPPYPNYAQDADRLADDYFCKTFNFTR